MEQKKKAYTILVVDDDPVARGLLEGILKDDYNVITSANGEEALKKVKDEHNLPDLILLDVIMPGMNGYHVCERLKANSKTRDIPVIFLTRAGKVELEEHGLRIGADDYIIKPIDADKIKARIEKSLKQKKRREQDVINSQSELIFIFGDIVEDRSGETINHVQRFSRYATILGMKAGLTADKLKILEVASPLHDIGKIYIPDTILKKTGELTLEERNLIDTHAKLGYDLLKHSQGEILTAAADIAHQHHEHWDGGGYPQGLKGKKICNYGRIAAIVDAFDAMATKRCYRKAWDKERIMKEFNKQKGKQFDPELTDLFLKHIEEFFKVLKMYPDTKQ